jgi:pilus assembly protein FimV
MYALYQANPQAFYDGNMNNLKGGARLRVPTEAELYELGDGEVFRGIREQYAQWQQRAPQGAATSAGAALAGISDEEASALLHAESPQALQGQLQRLTEENEAMQRRNEALKARLARLEQQVQQMSEQVLDYPAAQTPVDAEVAMEQAAPKSAVEDEPASQPEEMEAAGQQRPVEELPASLLVLLMLLTLGAGVVVWRYAMRAQKGGA